MRRRPAERDNQGGEQMLRDLDSRAPSSQPHVLRPVVLRAVALQGHEAAGGYARQAWVDRALLSAERLIAVVTLLGAAYWLADVPMRDWLYSRAQAQQRVEQEPVRPALSINPRVDNAGVRPSPEDTIPGVASLGSSQDNSQTSILRSTKQGNSLSAAAHPELGERLPSIGRGWRRPAVVTDYLAPARDYVAAAPPLPVAPAPAADPNPPADPRPVHIAAPSVGLDTSVVEVFLRDGVWEVADYAAGYLHGTGTPGDGNVVMAGHKGIRGAVFAGLEALKVGDEIVVDTAERRFHYRVRETGSVWPSQVNVMFPTTTPTLTLLTCTNWDMQRYVVIADLVSSAPLTQNMGG